MGSARVEALVAFDDGSGPHPPLLVAAGSGEGSSPLACGIAAWNGVQWTPLFEESGGLIKELAVYDRDGAGPAEPCLYASGYRPGAQGWFARWDGTEWVPDWRRPTNVTSMSVFDPDGAGPQLPKLFVGGGGGLKSFNGTSWQDVTVPGQTWYSHYVTALASVGEAGGPRALVVAGDFGGAAVWRWDGVTWQRVSTNHSRSPDAMAGLDDDGPGPLPPALYFTGDLFAMGLTPSGYFARFGCEKCYPNCDGSTSLPILNIQDFACFIARYAAADPYANCDGSSAVPWHDVQDFSCFLQQYAAGCP